MHTPNSLFIEHLPKLFVVADLLGIHAAGRWAGFLKRKHFMIAVVRCQEKGRVRFSKLQDVQREAGC
jgi:hypothetical protein